MKKINPPAAYKKYNTLICPDNGGVQRILKSRTYMGVLAQTQEGSEEKVCPNSYSGKIQTLCKRNRISKNKLCDIAGMALKIQFTAR